MPIVNVYHKKEEDLKILVSITPSLKEYISERLSGERKLRSKEISIRLISVEGDGMIGNIELEITAYGYEDRIKRQDEICNEIREYMKKELPSVGDIRVWLVLCQLGHSW